MIYSPHIKSPTGGEVFNRGQVTIEWRTVEESSEGIPEGEVEIFDTYPDFLPGSDQPVGYDPLAQTITPPSEVNPLTYEIEYTENYAEDDDSTTVWHALKKRIPQYISSYTWIVGKMIKSSSVRIRMRTKNMNNNETSDWSVCGGNFSVNVFKLLPPAIVSPVPGRKYNESMMIVLDESLSRDTYSQKVRYYIDYSSEKAGVDWLPIAAGVPVGQNVIKWTISDSVPPADDYIIRLTVKNSSCLEAEPEDPHQIARTYLYGIQIQHPGLFIIDTRPPRATLRVDSVSGITNELDHTITISATDDTTDVETMQLRECDADISLLLGGEGQSNCPTVEQSIVDGEVIIGKPTRYSEHIYWEFEDRSGLHKLEGLFTDSGGNVSVSEMHDVYLPILTSSDHINDFLSILETEGGKDKEVVYACTSTGDVWRMDPFPQLVAHADYWNLVKIYYWNGQIFVFGTTNSISQTVYTSQAFTLSKSGLFEIYGWMDTTAIITCVQSFQENLYTGFANGHLYSYDLASWVDLKDPPFSSGVTSLAASGSYLYIGLENSPTLFLYNGTTFTEVHLES